MIPSPYVIYIKEKQKVKSIFKKFLLFGKSVDRLYYQSKTGKRESFIFPAFSLVRINGRRL
jgi:hypothetical protein